MHVDLSSKVNTYVLDNSVSATFAPGHLDAVVAAETREAARKAELAVERESAAVKLAMAATVAQTASQANLQVGAAQGYVAGGAAGQQFADQMKVQADTAINALRAAKDERLRTLEGELFREQAAVFTSRRQQCLLAKGENCLRKLRNRATSKQT